MKGLLVNTYRAAGMDCTNGGVSSRVDSFILVDPTAEEPLGPFEPSAEDIDAGRVLLVGYVEMGGKKFYHAKPYKPEAEDGKTIGPMAGGNLVSTSDSRFRRRFGEALSIHDRYETPEDYAVLSR